MQFRVFIDGKEGTTGIEIFERLRRHPFVSIVEIDEDKRKDSIERKKLINSSDVTFLCLPDAAAVEAVALIDNEKTIVIDASTAHRINKKWAYGFPELSFAHRENIKSSTRIANPGCYASGFISLVYPLIKMKIMQNDYPCICHAVSGYSGGGKKLIAEYQNPQRALEYCGLRQYALDQTHKHQPEMKAIAGLTHLPIFNPSVGDFYSGMAVSVPIHSRLLHQKMNAQKLHEQLAEYYSGQVFVKVMPFMGDGVIQKGFLPSNHLAGTNDLEIYVFGNDERILLAACLDNLGKGASGAAVQSMNIALGLNETTGLIE